MRSVKLLLIGCCTLLGTWTPVPSTLQQVLEQGALRVITRNSPTAYYLGPEGPRGPEYELVSRFADELGVELNIEAAESFGDILPAVAAGRYHIAAAHLTVTEARTTRVDFGYRYQEIRQLVVYQTGSRRPQSIEELIGSHIEVVSGTSHAETLYSLRDNYLDLVWIENPDAESEELMYRVSTGDIAYTIADSTEFLISRNFHPEIRSAFAVSPAEPVAWAFRRHDDSLRRRAEEFFRELEASGELQRILDRYYGRTDRFDYVGTRTFLRHVQTRLPQYRSWFEAAAAASGIDWRLLAAMGYQESHWNPDAVSPTGVRGLMMLTQTTAAALGIEDRTDPRASIMGGAEYFRQVRERIPERIPEPDRSWFALAAYNVGWGHLEDARILTEIHGRDPDRWSEVREYLPLLSQQRWYRRLKYGYARGWEPVLYVRNIRNYYDILSWLMGDDGAVGIKASDSAPRGEEVAQQRGALIGEQAGLDDDAVVELSTAQQIEYAAGGAAARVRAGVDQPGDPRMYQRAGAHRAGLERHVQRCAR